MRVFFRIIIKIFLILTILAESAATMEIPETDSDTFINQEKVLLEEGKYDLSINDFNKAQKINIRPAEFYNNRGLIYEEKGQYDKAISDYNKAIDINPRFAEAYNNRAFVYFYIWDYEKALDDVYKAQNLGYKVHLGLLNALRQASGREK